MAPETQESQKEDIIARGGQGNLVCSFIGGRGLADDMWLKN